MRGEKVLVFGDLIVDEFLYGNVSRISPEAPVPILDYSMHSTVLGGAANAAANIFALGGAPFLVGCIGNDYPGDQFQEKLVLSDLSDKGIIVDTKRQTTQKTRIIADTQQIVRIDREDTKVVSNKIAEQIKKKLADHIKSVKAVLISDYQKGTVHPDIVTGLINEAAKLGLPVIVDTKAVKVDAFKGATIFTPNMNELQRISNVNITDQQSLSRAAHKLLDKTESVAVLATQSEQGMTLFTKQNLAKRFPTRAIEVHDVTGAGDTVAATITLAMAAGLELDEAVVLANYAAAVVVRKVGTAVADLQEINLLIEGEE